MLVSLLVKDFALIENLEVSFGSGLTILTGETGAGKSILIDALGLVLGERSDTTMIRNGAGKTIVEAVFEHDSSNRIQSHLQKMEVDVQPQLIIRREVSIKGQSRCFVNDSPVSVSALKTLGDMLVDVHGQHEHQSLLNSDTHIEILDSFGELSRPLNDYEISFNELKLAIAELNSMYHRRQTLDERHAVVEYQLREINKVNPILNEDDEIDHELRLKEYSERLAVLSREIIDVLYDGDDAVIAKMGRVEKLLDELSKIDDSMKTYFNEHQSATAIIEESVRAIRDYENKIEFEPERIESMRLRLADLIGLKRKFNCTLAELIAKQDALQSEYDSMDSLDDTIAKLETNVQKIRSECSKKAAILSEKRNQVSVKLGKQIESILKELGIAQPQFKTNVSTRDHSSSTDDLMYLNHNNHCVVPHARGWDYVEFYLSTNVGEDVKPLAKVVSGGEVSRIMLAIKSILAEHDQIPLLVFDEIDVGVSGKIAQKVGASLKKLSKYHQIISITHLPQIAAFGDHHLSVEKIVTGKRTSTQVRSLNQQERQLEIARLLSGHEVTKSSLQSAKELMQIN